MEPVRYKRFLWHTMEAGASEIGATLGFVASRKAVVNFSKSQQEYSKNLAENSAVLFFLFFLESQLGENRTLHRRSAT